MLDICTSAYRNSRIRCNAEVGGCTGYAALKAASSYDMLVNLSTTRTDGGWMYFKLVMTTVYNYQVVITKKIFIKTQLDVGGDAAISGQLNVLKNNSSETQPILENTGGSYCSLYLEASGVEGQIYAGVSIVEIRTNTNRQMRFKTGGYAQPATMTIDTNMHLRTSP